MDPLDKLRHAIDDGLRPVRADRAAKEAVLRRAREEAAGRKTRRAGRLAVRYGLGAAFAVAAIVVTAALATDGLSGLADRLRPPSAALPPSPTDRDGTGPQPSTGGARTAVLTPGYVPDRFTLQKVVSSAGESDPSPTITVRYASGDGYFDLSQSRVELPVSNVPASRIDIVGKPAELRIKKSGEFEMTWRDGPYRFKLTGNIPQDEAMKIAGSIEIEKMGDDAS
ncbi:DUF4367 domain-containing protein [Paenibacillus flagellatus]|uniref:DUF4367 domain-containing protein n=1 Tax=Paenibacillus flagellatus TaxID=2211139 RepID=A0A2V5K8P1_9BACL|nr:DUF4367 domain-containing protein [Paenibacillus flagellatus]PYI55758.1 hypothetical protein DLM86_08545 [Paenibacillus flagellatus]